MFVTSCPNSGMQNMQMEIIREQYTDNLCEMPFSLIYIETPECAYSLQNIVQNVEKNAAKIARQFNVFSTGLRFLGRVEAYPSFPSFAPT